jgi:hypothetical protein
MFLSKLERSFGPSCPPLALPMVKQKKKEKKKNKKKESIKALSIYSTCRAMIL